MPSVLDRSALEQSPLADLHLLANELGVDGFRRLRKPDLVDAILTRQGGEAARGRGRGGPAVEEPVARKAAEARRRRRRPEALTPRSPRWAWPAPRRGRGRPDGRPRRARRRRLVLLLDDREERSIDGTVELLANGSGFLRVSPPDESDQDVYISAAQVKRCELVSGDKISGPVRPARRSERFSSLIRVETINGRPAEEVAEGTRFEDLAVAWPDERIQLGSPDPTVRAIEWLTPFGKGSRVVITGLSRSGKTEALRRLAAALAGRSGLEVSAVLTGVRPEEALDFPVTPSAVLSFASSSDAQAQAVEQAVETGRRVAARGGDAVVLIDGFEYLPASAARRALAAGRNLAGGGSLTVIATSPDPVGGETTVVTLDRAVAATGTFPALALGESGHAARGAAGRRGGCRGAARRDRRRRPHPAAAPGAAARAGRGRARAGDRAGGGRRPRSAALGPGARRRQAQARASQAGRAQARGGGQEAGGREEAGRGGQEARREGGREEARGGGQEAAAAAKKPAAAAKKPAAAAKKPAAKRKAAAKKPAAK